MDLEDTKVEAEYRARARAFLEANCEPRSGKITPAEPYQPGTPAMQAAKAWQAKKAEAGFAGIRWPEKWGGQGGGAIQEVIYAQEESRFNTPPRGVYEIGLGMCLPTMIAYATDEQLERYTGPALRGEEIWCQLFSEPAAGSDLAGLRTRAVRDGDDWVINGQKIWTSGAHFCDFAILVTRTDPSVPKHKGLTMFFIDMHDPAVEVRPIHQMSGASNFNEVFFTDLRVPDSQRLGAVGDGWRVALTTLMNERLAVGDEPRPDIEDLIAFVSDFPLNGKPAIEDPVVRDKVADWYARSQGVKNARFRAITALSRGETPGPGASIGRLVNAIKQQEMARFALELMGAGGIVSDPAMAPAQGAFQQSLLSSPGQRIAGGTSEILRNIIAERVLGLPGDVRVDKDVAFQDIGKA
ncbi:acyl-CoA dehydrogenase family protein [Pseudooceanicola sp.]|uniref:acyl-CoA dehydrogenase family protein n=1 Tax=Pseudooceanicola sp. TaxID=1914328 RepID=UPI002602D24E|nr:acyl-CoA dehydrogenase family protein [Pseudooceanicola sp.]MDF1856585.1 acyl-CoA dehydrogenase family protein [Pseudooceanicola sp.]